MNRQLTINLRGLLKGFFTITTLGWLNALYTLWHRQSLLYGNDVAKSFCNISDAVNCDRVAMAPESALFWGYPNSGLGIIFYCVGFFIAWSLYSEQSGAKARTQAKLLLWVTILGMLPTLYLAYVSLFQIKSICLMCLTSYILNTLLVVFAFLLVKRVSRDEAPSAMTSALPKGALLAMAISAGIQFPFPWIFKSIASAGLDEATVGNYLYNHQNAPKYIFSKEAPTMGDPNAPVQIVEFADFQCPACAHASDIVPDVVKSFGSKVSLTFKNFPLDVACNEAMETTMHPVACDAAKAGLCVYKEKGADVFFKFNHAVFKNYNALSVGIIESLAKENGIEAAQLKECMQSGPIQEELRRQTLEAKAAGVRATPSFYINGKYLEGAQAPIILRKVINDYLKP